jgi:uncharacterized RDD family membrane protein YckC
MQDFDLIETPENVELVRPLAGIGSRMIAGIIDNLLIIGVYAVLLILAFVFLDSSPADLMRGPGGTGVWGLAVLIVIFFLVYWGYFVAFEMLTNGQSPGKKHMRIRVVKEGGAPIRFTDIAIRNLLRAVDCQGFYTVAGVCMFLTRKAQRLGDLAAGTVVLSEQVRDYSAKSDRPLRVRWEQEASATALRATGLSPQEYSVLRNYWSRRDQLTLEARMKLLPRLLEPVLARAGLQPGDYSLETLEDCVSGLLRKAEEADGAQLEGRP